MRSRIATCLTLAVVLASAATAQSSADANTPATYRLGPDDQVMIRVIDVDELNGKTAAIDLRGYLDIPLVGHVQAAGMTVEQLKAEVEKRLRQYVNVPKVSVTVAEYRSQPVSVLGSVNKPGVYYLTGENTLLQFLSRAGGLSDNAGNTIQITRAKTWGPIPLPLVRDDATSQFTMGRVRVRPLLEAQAPAENIVIRPNDIISVPRAEMVYVMGAVRRPGGFILNDREDMSVLQALALAEGLERVASGARAKIIRKGTGDAREEIPADLKKMLSGKALDFPLKANDILFIPASAARSATMRGIEAAIQLGTGIAIFRR